MRTKVSRGRHHKPKRKGEISEVGLGLQRTGDPRRPEEPDEHHRDGLPSGHSEQHGHQVCAGIEDVLAVPDGAALLGFTASGGCIPESRVFGLLRIANQEKPRCTRLATWGIFGQKDETDVDALTEKNLKALAGRSIAYVNVRSPDVVEFAVPESEGWRLVVSATPDKEGGPALGARWEPGLRHRLSRAAEKCTSFGKRVHQRAVPAGPSRSLACRTSRARPPPTPSTSSHRPATSRTSRPTSATRSCRAEPLSLFWWNYDSGRTRRG